MSEMCDLLTIFKNKFRKIENLTKKCVNLEGAIKFNKTCLNNRIYPVHVKIYISMFLDQSLREISTKCYGNLDYLIPMSQRTKNNNGNSSI